MKRFCLCILAVSAISFSACAEVFETQIEQKSGEDGAFAQFKLWIPPNIHPTRVIALTWGSNQCSLDVVNNPEWQNLAKSMEAGLLTCFFTPQTTSNHWDQAAGGSGRALLDALPVLAQLSGEAQLANARFYMVGDSQGGQFSFSFAGWKPHRVLGFVSVKGGRHDASAIETAAQTPGLFFVGELDVPYRVENIKQTFRLGRTKNAPWCLAVDKQGKHDPDPCAPLLRTFLQELPTYLKASIPGPPAHPEPRDIDAPPPSWFPSAKFKDDWANFEAGNLVTGTPNLSFESKMPSNAGSSMPYSCDLGAINAGEKSQLITLRISSGTQARWDQIRVLDRPYLSEVTAANSATESRIVSFKLNTQKLPLGRFSGVIPVRFIQQHKPVSGGLNIPLTATVIGDVVTAPLFIDLQPQSSREKNQSKLKSALNQTR